MNNYSKCLNCGSREIISDLGFQDAGAYASGSHRVTVDTVHTSFTARLVGKNAGTSIIRAAVCVDCGYTALIAQNPEELVNSEEGREE